MDKKPYFSELTIKLANKMSNGFCMIAGCLNRVSDLHHRISNTIPNNKKYPLFLQSIFNCLPICRKCHDDYSLQKNIAITEKQAEAYEAWLTQFGKDYYVKYCSSEYKE